LGSNISCMLLLFCTKAGVYEVALLVGDAQASQGIVWDLGNFELLLPSSDPSPAVRTAHSQPISNARPVITHMFVSAA